MYDLLGLSLALAALLTINALATIASATLWRAVARPARAWSAEARARLIFALRIFPATAASTLVVTLFVPSYVAYEPWPTGEVVSVKLGILALLSALGIALALWRGIAAWRATRRLVANWLHHAEPVSIEGISIPAYCVQHSFPVIAVVGVIRPRLFVASRIFDALNADELRAAITHEAGHLAARDNLKRWLVRACRDVLVIFPSGRSLDRAWAEATEAAADEYAARAGAAQALDLASALIKIARIVPQGARPIMPAGAFLIGEKTPGGIEARVCRLARMAEISDDYKGHHARVLITATWMSFCTMLVAVAFAATNPRVLATLHTGIEQIVLALN